MSPPREAPAQTCVWPVESGVIGVPRAVRGGVYMEPRTAALAGGAGLIQGARGARSWRGARPALTTGLCAPPSVELLALGRCLLGTPSSLPGGRPPRVGAWPGWSLCRPGPASSHTERAAW